MNSSINFLPGNLPPSAVGAVFYYAFVAVDPGTSRLTWASNAVDVTIAP